MKILIGFIFGIAIGGSIVKFYMSPTRVTVQDHRMWAEAGINQISTQSDSAKQLQEAEKYYGKAVVLFLASLYSQNSKLSVVHNEGTMPSIASDSTPELSEQKLGMNDEGAKPNQRAELESKKEGKKQISDKGGDIDRLVTFRKAPLLTTMTPEVKKLNGIFHGTLTHAAGDKKGRVDQVDMDFFLQKQEDKLVGLINIQLTDPEGHIYSNSTNEGGNNKVRPFKGGANKIYIEPVPGDFIIMDVSNEKQMTGEYYKFDGTYI